MHPLRFAPSEYGFIRRIGCAALGTRCGPTEIDGQPCNVFYTGVNDRVAYVRCRSLRTSSTSEAARPTTAIFDTMEGLLSDERFHRRSWELFWRDLE